MKHIFIIAIRIILLVLFVPIGISAQITDVGQIQEGTNYMLFGYNNCREGGALTITMGAYNSVLGYSSGDMDNYDYDIQNSIWTCEKDGSVFRFKNERGGYIKNDNELTWDRESACLFEAQGSNGFLYFCDLNYKYYIQFRVYDAKDCVVEIDGLKYIPVGGINLVHT